MEMIFLNKYSVFYLVFTIITGGIAYLTTNKVIVGLFVVLFVMNFIFFLTFFNADDKEIKDVEEVFKGEDSDKDDD
jgi:hypothetical protein